MTGEDGKRGSGAGDVTTGANMNANVTDNANNVNANVNANINVSQQNGGPEKAPVVGGTNVETLPRAGKQSDPSTAFLRAARAGQLEKVLEYLESGVDINASNANGLNALHLAAKDGHLEIVRELLNRGAVVDAATKKGNTALHIASLAGQEEVVQLLVQRNASVNAQSQNGFTPLYMAAQENHDSVVKYLLNKGANQTLATEDGFTPLAVAMQQGHDKVVAVLLENDTRGKVRLPALHIAAKKDDCKAAALLLQNDHNPDVTSKSGFTPLHIAAHYGNDRIASLLYDRGADVNFAAKHNITPMHVAAKWGKIKMVNLLMSKGANIEAKTRDGLTPLHCAARSGHHEVVDILIEKGAPIGSKTKNGLAPLHMASQGDHVDAARILLYHRAPVDEVTVDYLTALHVAAHCGHVRVAKLLLDRNADPNARALNGFTPLHIACKKNRIKVVELLLKHKASIEATTESGLTPLHVASFMGCMNIVIYLLQHEASPDIPTVRGETPLHLAARANQTDIIRILLRNGAQVDARAREEQTPLHVASRLGNVDIVMLLLQHGAGVDATTKDLYTPLHIAAKEGQEEVASVLLENSASLTATTKKGFTPLHLAAKYGNMNVARLLLQKNAPVDAQGKNGVTPLHVASHYDHQNVALLLLDKGASPHAMAKNGHTPLHIAARKNQMDIATTLLEYGAKANAESKAGFTPLHLSAQEGHTDMSTLLIEHKADTNHKAKNGLTPLHLCAQEDKVNVASILVKNGAQIDAKTKAGYTPLHVASHFGQAAMVRFLLRSGAAVDSSTNAGYTPLHQAAQQGHTLVINLLLESKAKPNAVTNNGQTALDIAQKLGYISVIETLKVVTETIITTTHTVTIEEKYRVQAPESMQETFMSDSEDEGGGDEIGTAAMNVYGQPPHAQHVYLPSYYQGQMTYTREDPMLSDQQQYRYMTVDDMKSMGDDSMRVNVTDDERDNRHSGAPTITEMITKENYQRTNAASLKPDNVDINRHPVHVGIPQWRNFLVSFLVDARGGAMRGCRHSGVRVIVPPRKAAMPMRVTCRYLRRDKLTNPPPLMEGEALASRILELGPVGAKFLGPVIIEVPHFASLRGKEREIVILRSDNGETWREHTLEASEEAVQDVLNESFEGEELSQLEDLQTSRIVRILTVDFPHYFAVVSRIRQEVHAVGPEGGTVSSSAVPQVQAVFPQAALTKKIRVGLQAHPIPADLVAKLLGNRVAVSPIVTVEPRRRKFHKPITLTIPVPQAANKGMINQYSGDAPTLRLLCSITGGQTRAVWEDVTGSTPLTFVKDCVSFTTTVSARFWLMDCRNISEATKMATELYTHATHVPFMAKFVVFAKRIDPLEARLRVFCMTDDKEDKTLEHQEHFTEVAKSRDVEVLEGKTQYMEFSGNLVPVLKTGEQLQLPFRAFKENRVPFTARIKDPDAADMMGRIMFMSEPKVPRGELPQTPICTLNILLPEKISPDTAVSELDLLELSKNYSFLRDGGISRPDAIHRATIRLTDIANLLDKDWEPLAEELNIPPNDVALIKQEYPDKPAQQAAAMFKIWQNNGNKATGNTLEKALNKIGREDIVNKCIFNVELVTDDVEKAVARVRLDQPGFDSLKEELGPSRNTSLRRDATMDLKMDPDYEEPDRMKESESVEDLSTTGSMHDKSKEHITITNGTVFNGTSTPIKDKYASDEKELGDMMADYLEQKCHMADTMSKKSRDELDDLDKKRQKVIADANKIVSGVIADAEKEKGKLAKEGWSVVYDDDARDSKEARGAIGQTLTNIQLDKTATEPKGIVSKPVVEQVPSIEPPMVRQYHSEKPDPRVSILKTAISVSDDSKVSPSVITKTTIIKQFDQTPAKTTTTTETVIVLPDKKDVVSEKEKLSKEGKEIDEKLVQGAIPTSVMQKTVQVESVTRTDQKMSEVKADMSKEKDKDKAKDKDKEKNKDTIVKSTKPSAYEDIYNVQHPTDNTDEKSDEETKKTKDKSSGIFSNIFKGSKLKKGKKGSKDVSFDSGDEELPKAIVTKVSEQQPEHPPEHPSSEIIDSSFDSRLPEIIVAPDVKLATVEFLNDSRRIAADVPYESFAKPTEKEDKKVESTESDDDSKDKTGFFSNLFKSKSKKDDDGTVIPVIHVEKPKESAEQIAKKEKKRLAALAKEKEELLELQMKEKAEEAEIPSTIEKEVEKATTKDVKAKDIESKEVEKTIVTTDEQSHSKDDKKEEEQVKEKGSFFGIFKSPKSKEKKLKETSFDNGDEEIRIATEKLLDDTRKITDFNESPVAYKSDDSKSIPKEEIHTFVSTTHYDIDIPADKIGKSYDVVQTMTKTEKTIIHEEINGKADIDENKDQKGEKKDAEKPASEIKSEISEMEKVSDDTKEKSGGFFGIFKSPKLKSKKRSRSREQSSSKDTSFDSGDEEVRLATAKLLEDTKQMAENLQHPTGEISETVTKTPPIDHVEIKKSIIHEDEVTEKDKGSGIFSIFRSPKQARSSRSRSKEKTPSLELPDSGQEDLRNVTAKFLEDSRNAAIITDELIKPEHLGHKITTETKDTDDKLIADVKKIEHDIVNVVEDVCKITKDDQDTIGKKVEEKIHDIVDSAEAKDKTIKEAKKAKEKGSGFLSGIFKGAKHAVEEVSDDIKEFLDDTKKEATLEEARDRETTTAGLKDLEEKKDSVVASAKDTTDKVATDMKDDKDKIISAMKGKKNEITEKISKDIEKAADNTKVVTDIVPDTKKIGAKIEITAKDVAHADEKIKETTEIKEDATAAKEKLSSDADLAIDAVVSAKDKAAKEAKKIKEKGTGFFSGIFKGAKHTVDDAANGVKELLDETKKEAVLEENSSSKEKAAASLKDLKNQKDIIVTEVQETTDKAVTDAKDAKDKTISIAKEKKDKIVEKISEETQQIATTTKIAGDKIGKETKKIAEKIGAAAADIAQDVKDTKNEAVKEVKEDTTLLKQKLSAGTDLAVEKADRAKDKTTKEAKKAKDKTGGFLSSIFKSAKHAVEDATDDVKEFLDETKKEAALEEEHAKEEIAISLKEVKDKKDAVVSGVQETAEKVAADTKDAKDTAISAVKDKKDKIVEEISKDTQKVADTTKDVGEKITLETKKIDEKIESTVLDVVQNIKDTKDTAIKEAGEDIKLVKDKVTAGVDAVTKSAEDIKDKAAKEAKKGKEKTSGFFSGIFKGAKHTAEHATEDVKEFLDETRREASLDKEYAKEEISVGLKDLKDKKDAVVTKIQETAERTAADAKDVKDKTISDVKDKKDKIVEEISKEAHKVADTTKAASDKITAETKKISEKIEKTAADITQDVKDTVVKELKEDTTSVKEKLSANADVVAETADKAKDKMTKEAKKAKDKTGGFLSGIFKGAKHAVEDATDDVKEFMDETKKEAVLEEERAKEKIAVSLKDVKDKRDAVVSGVQETAEKVAADTRDAKDKTISVIKDKKDKIVEQISKDTQKVADTTKAASDKITSETKEISEKVESTVVDVVQNIKDTKDTAIKEAGEDIKLVKDNVTAGVDAVTKSAEDIKDKAAKEAKKGKEKTSGFFSGIFKGAKHTAEQATEDIKEFLDETRREVSLEKEYATEEVAASLKDVKDKRDGVVTKIQETAEKTAADAKDAKNKAISDVKDKKDKITDTTKAAGEKITTETKEISEKIKVTAADITQDVKDIKDAAIKEVEEDTTLVKEKLATGTDVVVEQADRAKDKMSKEAKKAKDKTSGFFSGIFKGVKHGIEDATDDIKEFLDETKKETALEETHVKEVTAAKLKDIEDKKDIAVAEDKTITTVKDMQDKITEKISEDFDKFTDAAQNAKNKVTSEVKEVGEKVDSTVRDITQGVSDTKDATVIEIKDGVKMVKEKLSAEIETVADDVKGMATKEAKKAKDKGSGFLSGIVKGAKHAVENARDDVKEFLDETKYEAELEEARAKEAAGLKELEYKKDSKADSAKSVTKDVTTDVKDKLSEDTIQVVGTTVVDKLVIETKKIGNEIEFKVADVSHDIKDVKGSVSKEMKKDTKAVKNKLVTSADAVAESTKVTKEKLEKDTKKAKDKGSDFLSGVIQGAKHTGKEISDDVKDFLESTKQEAAADEALAKVKFKKLEQDKATDEVKIVTEKPVKGARDIKEKGFSGMKGAKEKTISTVRMAGDKVRQNVSQAGEKIKSTSHDATQKAKLAKGAIVKETKEDTQVIKEKLTTDADIIADSMEIAKDETTKEAKKTKQKAGGFLSGMVKSAKHAVEDVTDDMKEFLEETKQEAVAEEARAKSDAQAKDKSAKLLTDAKDKSVGAVKDASKKRIVQKGSKSPRDAKGTSADVISSIPKEMGKVKKTLTTETRKAGDKLESKLINERVQEVGVRDSIEIIGRPEVSGDVEHLIETVRDKRISRIPQKISPSKEITDDVVTISDDSGLRRIVETVTTIGHPEPRTRHSVTTVVTKSVRTTPPPPDSLAEFTDSRTEDVTEEAARQAQHLAEQASYTSTKAGHDSAEIDGTVERHATSAPSKQPVPAPRHSTKPSIKSEFHLELGDASRIRKTVEQPLKLQEAQSSSKNNNLKSKIPLKIDSRTPQTSDKLESVPLESSKDRITAPQAVSRTVKYVTREHMDGELIKETAKEKSVSLEDTLSMIKPDNMIETVINDRVEMTLPIEEIRRTTTTIVTSDPSVDPEKLEELLKTGGVVETVRTVTLTSEDDVLQPMTREEVVKRINQVASALPSEIFDFGDKKFPDFSTTIIKTDKSESDDVQTITTVQRITMEETMPETEKIEKVVRTVISSSSDGGDNFSDAEALKNLRERLTKSEIGETTSWVSTMGEQWETMAQYSQDTSPSSGNGGAIDMFVASNNKNGGSSRHDMHSDTDSDSSPQPRRRSPSKRRTLGSSSGSDVALHEGAELSPLEDDQETHGMVPSVCSSNTIEAKTRTKTPGRANCACWMSIAVAVLVLLIALILALEPHMFRRVIYILSNNVPKQAGYDHPSHLLNRVPPQGGTYYLYAYTF
ncbi:ankyrin-2-like isoform X15 [Cataglyphis hispanica]|uniref:ankyrin-2-like isoform X15 n=1 Tax=Cataglyphis hispanica TaxID=1086592 RepID=UPI00217F344C|nr:ankyrin-2-like isoform X15 [Cataglyphis hispanica]